jgi:hypothetical protein
MGTIFVSYRRDDSEGEAGRLFGDLVSHFGQSSVFMDVAGIQVGRDFRKAIDESVSSCGVLLAIIGKNWLEAKNEAGERRLDDPSDFVRLETASALKRDIPVIPVLVRGAKMPRPHQLPDDLKDLAYRNGCELTHARWGSDLQRLIAALRPYVEDSKSKRAAVANDAPESIQKKPRWAMLGALLSALVVVMALVAYLIYPPQTTVPDLTGASIEDATAKLAAAHLAVGKTGRQTATKPPGTLLGQSPAPNARVKPGTPVDLVFAIGPEVALVAPSPQAAEPALRPLRTETGAKGKDEPKSEVTRNAAPTERIFQTEGAGHPTGALGTGIFQGMGAFGTGSHPAEPTPKSDQTLPQVQQLTSQALPVAAFDGIWVQTDAEGDQPPMRLDLRQNGSQIKVQLSSTDVFGNIGHATVQNGVATWSLRQGCAERFQKPGFSYDNPGMNIFTLTLRDSRLLYEKETRWTVPCDGHSIGTEKISATLRRFGSH